jgi:hypothetical protein
MFGAKRKAAGAVFIVLRAISGLHPAGRHLEKFSTHIWQVLYKCCYCDTLETDELHEEIFMSRISIDVTSDEHKKLKAMAALHGKSIKDYVIERTLGAAEDADRESALEALESLLDARIHRAKNGAVSQRNVGAIFKDAHREAKRK